MPSTDGSLVASLADRVDGLLGDRGPTRAVLAVGRANVGPAGRRHASAPPWATDHEAELGLDESDRHAGGVAATAYALATTSGGEVAVVRRGGIWNRPQALVIIAPIADTRLRWRWTGADRTAGVLWHLDWPDGRWSVFLGPLHGFEIEVETFLRAFGDRAQQLTTIG